MEKFKKSVWPDWGLSSSINARYINKKIHKLGALDLDNEEFLNE